MIYNQGGTLHVAPDIQSESPQTKLMEALGMRVLVSQAVPPGMMVMLGAHTAIQWTEAGGVDVMDPEVANRLRRELLAEWVGAKGAKV